MKSWTLTVNATRLAGQKRGAKSAIKKTTLLGRKIEEISERGDPPSRKSHTRLDNKKGKGDKSEGGVGSRVAELTRGMHYLSKGKHRARPVN